MSYIPTIAKLLEDSEGSKKITIEREVLLGFSKELGERAELGAALSEAAQAIRGAQIHPRLVSIVGEAWRKVVSPPNFAPMSQVGLEELTRQALASAKALIPATMALPPDAVLEIPMMAILLRLIDRCRS